MSVVAPLPAAVDLGRHPSSGRRAATTAPFPEHWSIVGSLPATGPLPGARLRTAPAVQHPIPSTARYWRSHDFCPPSPKGRSPRGSLAIQETVSQSFTGQQSQWLEATKDHIASSVSVDLEAFQMPPSTSRAACCRPATGLETDCISQTRRRQAEPATHPPPVKVLITKVPHPAQQPARGPEYSTGHTGVQLHLLLGYHHPGLRPDNLSRLQIHIQQRTTKTELNSGSQKEQQHPCPTIA